MANNITFFNSADVDLFPISLARNPSSTKRPYARTLSEDNLRSITSNLVDTKSFVISKEMLLNVNRPGETNSSYEMSPFEFILNGYYVKLRASDIPRELWASKDIYATILVDNWNYENGYGPKLIGTDYDTSGAPDIKTAIMNTLIDAEGNGKTFTIPSNGDVTEIYKLTTETEYTQHDATVAQGELVFTAGTHQLDNVSASHPLSTDLFSCTYPRYEIGNEEIVSYDGSISCSEGTIEIYHLDEDYTPVKLLTLSDGKSLELKELVPELTFSDGLLLRASYLGNSSTQVIGTAFIYEELGDTTVYYGYKYPSTSGQDYIDVFQQDVSSGFYDDPDSFGSQVFRIKTDFTEIVVYDEHAGESAYSLSGSFSEHKFTDNNELERTLKITYGGGSYYFDLHLPGKDNPDLNRLVLDTCITDGHEVQSKLSLDDGLEVPIQFIGKTEDIQCSYVANDSCWLRFIPDGDSTTAYFTIEGAPEIQRLTLEGHSGLFKEIDDGTAWTYPVYKVNDELCKVVSPALVDAENYESKFVCKIVDDDTIQLELENPETSECISHNLSQDANVTSVYKLLQEEEIQYSIEFNNDVTDIDSTHIQGTFKLTDNRIDSLKIFGEDYNWTAALDTLEFDSSCEGYLPISFYCHPRYKDESFEDCYLNVFLYDQNDVAQEYNLVGNVVSTASPSSTPATVQSTVSTVSYVNKYLGIVFTDFDPSIPNGSGEYVKFIPFNNTVCVNYTYSDDPYESDTYSTYSLHILTADETTAIVNWNTSFNPLPTSITRYKRFVAPEVSQYKLTTRSISNIDGGEY